MPWADFWEMLDGRVWWEMRKAGVEEKQEKSDRQIQADREWFEKKAKQRGWS